MTSRKIALVCRRNLRHSRSLQILLIIAFWLVGDLLVRRLGLPVPGGVVGMFILIALFASRSFSPLNVRLGAEWFLAEMLLFFIPAVPAILNHHEFLGWLGLKVLVVILVGTAVVMIVTALVVDVCFRWNSRHKPLEVKQT
ncbi:MAG: CidA/LrgA family protein [Oryzomonas sp.]|uniref:CidA/LrgA family protein n=1 Tax=Oryzomonas sp. TaxID=2855186 RepID=UPI002843E4EE|nr:CidA/LrgA family protein [Oryzomonas sp.]MDR3580939.1 CidA/LrgA family protein [Oryzomonas sp.]